MSLRLLFGISLSLEVALAAPEMRETEEVVLPREGSAAAAAAAAPAAAASFSHSQFFSNICSGCGSTEVVSAKQISLGKAPSWLETAFVRQFRASLTTEGPICCEQLTFLRAAVISGDGAPAF